MTLSCSPSALLCLASFFLVRANPPQFPIPADPACHAFGSQRICNPDNLLTADDIASIDAVIQTYEQSTILCRGTQYGVQFGAYIEQHIGVSTASNVRNTATAIHNQWGVGYDTPCGGTGILLYLAIQDHQMYFSRGGALRPQLSDRDLQDAMQAMKPALRQNSYGEAIHSAVLALSQDLDVLTPTSGATPDTPRGNGHAAPNSDDLGVSIAGLITLLVATCCCTCCALGPAVLGSRKAEGQVSDGQINNNMTVKNFVHQKLKELDEMQQQVQQDQAYVTSSCPICLVSFPPSSLSSTTPTCSIIPTATATATNTAVASETTPLVQVSQVTTVAAGRHLDAPTFQIQRVGTDGKPLQMLPCGHVFDDTCVGETLKAQRLEERNATPTCPICHTSILEQPQPCNFLDGSAFDTETYHHERCFRLDVLQKQSDSAIPPALLLQWKGYNYGGSMVAEMQKYLRDQGRKRSRDFDREQCSRDQQCSDNYSYGTSHHYDTLNEDHHDSNYNSYQNPHHYCSSNVGGGFAFGGGGGRGHTIPGDSGGGGLAFGGGGAGEGGWSGDYDGRHDTAGDSGGVDADDGGGAGGSW